MGNELVAEVKESETVWSGSRLIEDGFDLKEAFESKSWVSGGLAVAATAADTAAAVMDPLGEALSAGVGWIIEHLWPLKDWLNELAGDSDAVAAAASTWTNIGTKLNSCAGELEAVCSSRLAGQESLAVATFKTLQAGSASHLRMTGEVAGAISGGLTLASVIVRVVHDMVRDAIADVIGKLTSKAAIMAVSLGTAAPWAVSSVAADVSSWVTRLSKEVADVVLSSKNLKNLLYTARALFDDVATSFAHIPSKIGDSLASIPTKVGETASRGMDNLARGVDRRIENVLDVVDNAMPQTRMVTPDGQVLTLAGQWRMMRQTDTPRYGGGGSGPRGGNSAKSVPVKKSEEAFDRAQEAKQEVSRGRRLFLKKTTSSDHVETLSGWSMKGRPERFQEPNINEVLAKQEEIGHDVRRAGALDHGVDGQYYASHAERQLSINAEEPYIGVSKVCCKNCQQYFSKLAQHEGRDWYVTDPKGTLVFGADGSVVRQK
ncbi:hypothetical protein AoKodu_02170 [Actinomyces oris K20]|uniref:hypothetical protein n=1 Tax=Actinomyces oris TaxID=544580 RepID=UPI002058ABE4|nr:hypothetical protein [Actinomyces oris]BDF97916.1 hypothetical protein AoKodu_02170 [Actinomyces oris K20]